MDLAQLLSSNFTDKNIELVPPVQLKPFIWQEIRLFLSSSFIDTHAERNVLVKRVIPNLNRQLAPSFIRIVPVDLRWGVISDKSLNACYSIQKTCLNQVDKCRRTIEEHPWFLGLRTERYGWVQDKLMPSVGFENPQNFDWIKMLEEYEKELSITSMECVHATAPSWGVRAQPTVFFYKRHIDNYENIEENRRWIFDLEVVPEDTEVSEEVQHQYRKDPKASLYEADRNGLDSFLENSSGAGVKYSHYHCRYEKGDAKITGQDKSGKMFGVGYVSELEDFEGKVEKDLLEAVRAHFVPAVTANLPKQTFESIQHENAVRMKRASFVGRSKLCETIWKYCTGEAGDVDSPLIIHGPPGFGKSALLANVSTKCLNVLRGLRGDFVFVHVVDSCASSNNLDSMLRRLNIALRCYRREAGETKISEEGCPKSPADLKNEHLKFLLESASQHPDKQFVVFVDAVNQFHDGLQAWSMWWSPNNLPRNLKVVISTLEKENGTFVNACQRCPDALKVPVTALSFEDGKEMVANILERFNKKLTTDDNDGFLGNQMKELLDKNLSPLYLTAATQALRTFGIYEGLTKYIRDLPSTVSELFDFLLEEWSKEYGECFVQDVAGLLYVSKDGLLENEINDILSFKESEEGFEYECSFSRLYDALCSFLAAGGSGYLRFFHDQLKYTVKRKFFKEDTEKNLHRWLVNFYLSCIQPQLREEPLEEPPAYYAHCLQQIVYHQIKSIGANVESQCFRDTLRNIYFVKERVEHQQEDLLQHEYLQAVRSATNEEQTALKQWATFAQIYTPFIKEFPHLAYNMATNQPTNSHVALDTQSKPKPQPREGQLFWQNNTAHEDDVVLKYTSESCELCTVNVDKNLCCVKGGDKVWLFEVDSGVLLHQVPMEQTTSILISNEFNTFWSGDEKGSVHVWSVDSAIEEWSASFCNERVIWMEGIGGDEVACGSGGHNVYTSDFLGSIAIFSESKRKITKTWSTRKTCFAYAFDRSSNQIYSGHQNLVVFWNTEGNMLNHVDVNGWVEGISVSPTSSDNILLQLKRGQRGNWNYSIRQISSKGEEMCCLIPDVRRGQGVTFLPKRALYDDSGERIFCVENDGTSLKVFSKHGQLEYIFKGHSRTIMYLALLPGKNSLLTAADDGSMLFNVPATNSQSTMVVEQSAYEEVNWSAVLPGGDAYVTLSRDGKLRLYDVGQSEARVSIDIVGFATLHPRGDFIVVCTSERLTCFDTSNLTTIATYDFPSPLKNVQHNAVLISPDGQKAVVTTLTEGAMVLDISNMEKIFHQVTYSTGKDMMHFSDIHDDNQRVATVCNGAMYLWDINTAEHIATFREGYMDKPGYKDKPRRQKLKVQFLYVPERILVCENFSGRQAKFHVISITGDHLITFDGLVGRTKMGMGHEYVLLNNDRQLVIGLVDNTLRVYDVLTGKTLYTFVDHRSEGFFHFLSLPKQGLMYAYNGNKHTHVFKTTEF